VFPFALEAKCWHTIPFFFPFLLLFFMFLEYVMVITSLLDELALSFFLSFSRLDAYYGHGLGGSYKEHEWTCVIM
jgi:hypothetical protein